MQQTMERMAVDTEKLANLFCMMFVHLSYNLLSICYRLIGSKEKPLNKHCGNELLVASQMILGRYLLWLCCLTFIMIELKVLCFPQKVIHGTDC
ncbi:hypothetical protein BC943DRAFT_64243 [Umbelopsis sp. AD052]|nr:hypothetical protein BC943DRAFT_64243 [Umbelopsis sp. AD052]